MTPEEIEARINRLVALKPGDIESDRRRMAQLFDLLEARTGRTQAGSDAQDAKNSGGSDDL